jgi:hypothetical protein
LETSASVLSFFLSFETQGLTLARQVLYHLSHSASPLGVCVLGIFEMGSLELLPWLASILDLPALCLLNS